LPFAQRPDSGSNESESSTDSKKKELVEEEQKLKVLKGEIARERKTLETIKEKAAKEKQEQTVVV
jgi:flagellar motility protein MotE (MotC chaperone)